MRQFIYEKLSKEEQDSRGILARLKGPISSYKTATRNGHMYNEQLWKKALASDTLKEKIDNKCLFLEFEHPQDGCTSDTRDRIAGCFAELPQMLDDGKIYGIIDILPTEMGKLVKILLDYGTTMGISSRAQGDLDDEDEYGNSIVNPETFELETWDLVTMPALKEARLERVNESLDKKRYNKTLKTALTECLNNVEKEDTKKYMIEQLNKAGIKLQEDDEEKFDDSQLAMSDEDVEKVNEPFEEEVSCEDVQKFIEKTSEKLEKANEDEDEDKSKYLAFVLKLLNDYNAEMCDNKDEEDSQPNEGENKETIDDDDESKEVIDVESPETKSFDVESLVNNLQEAVTERANLEESKKTLQEKLAVSDAKVNELNEEITKYKDATIRLSTRLNESKKSNDKEIKELNSKIAKLNESLESSNKTIETLNKEKENLNESLAEEKVKLLAKKRNLNENLDTNANKTQALTEELKKVKEDTFKEINSLKKQLNESKKESNAMSSLVDKLANKYIEAKAYALGLESDEIKNKLTENYTIEDVERICEELNELNSNLNSLPFNISPKARVEITRPKSIREHYTISNDDIVDDDLVNLANQI